MDSFYPYKRCSSSDQKIPAQDTADGPSTADSCTPPPAGTHHTPPPLVYWLVFGIRGRSKVVNFGGGRFRDV